MEQWNNGFKAIKLLLFFPHYSNMPLFGFWCASCQKLKLNKSDVRDVGFVQLPVRRP